MNLSDHFSNTCNLSFEAAVSKGTEDLKKEGFGILREIDIQETLTKKLNVDFRRVEFEGGARLVFRLYGTGTQGATLRVYLDRFDPDPAQHGHEAQEALGDLARAAEELAGLRASPTVVT